MPHVCICAALSTSIVEFFLAKLIFDNHREEDEKAGESHLRYFPASLVRGTANFFTTSAFLHGNLAGFILHRLILCVVDVNETHMLRCLILRVVIMSMK